MPPPASGTAGHLSGSDRATRCPTGRIPAVEGDASRLGPTGGVNRLVKYADVDTPTHPAGVFDHRPTLLERRRIQTDVLGIAKDYERLAERAEQRAREGRKKKE
jgi:hypothetical protein